MVFSTAFCWFSGFRNWMLMQLFKEIDCSECCLVFAHINWEDEPKCTWNNSCGKCEMEKARWVLSAHLLCSNSHVIIERTFPSVIRYFFLIASCVWNNQSHVENHMNLFYLSVITKVSQLNFRYLESTVSEMYSLACLVFVSWNLFTSNSRMGCMRP